MNERLTAAAILIVLSSVVATSDGLYFHLYKYKLYARPGSITEHWTHTLRALFYGPMVYLLFARNFAGPPLLGLAAVVAVDFGVQSWDVFVEKDSRAAIGGLSPLEYWIHVVSITTHVAAVTLVFSAKPASAWRLSAAPIAAGSWPSLAHLTALLIVPSAVGVGALHLWLLRPSYRSRSPVGSSST